MTRLVENVDVFAIRDSIRDWVALLANHEYELAAQFLTAVPGLNVEYDGETIREAVGRYSRAYRDAADEDRDNWVPVVSPPDIIGVRGENMVVYYTGGDGSLVVEYDLPLNGEWSDLTAKFSLFPVDAGFAIGLLDIRVL